MSIEILPTVFVLWLTANGGAVVFPQTHQDTAPQFSVMPMRPIDDDSWYDRRQPPTIYCDRGKPECERAYLIGRGKIFYAAITCTDWCVAMTIGKAENGAYESHSYEWQGTMTFGPGEFDTFIFELAPEQIVSYWHMEASSMYWTILNFHPYDTLCCPFTGLRR